MTIYIHIWTYEQLLCLALCLLKKVNIKRYIKYNIYNLSPEIYQCFFAKLSPVFCISFQSSICISLYLLSRNMWITSQFLLCSVGTRTFAFGYDGVLHGYPRAFQRASPLHASPAQERDVRGFGRFAHHALGNRTRPLTVAAPRADEPRPEPGAEVVPRVKHRTEGIRPQPHLQPALQLLTRFALLAPLHVKVQTPDVFGHQSGGVLLEVQLVQILVARVAVLGRRDGEKAAVKVSEDAPQLGFVQIFLPGVVDGVGVLFQLQQR